MSDRAGAGCVPVTLDVLRAADTGRCAALERELFAGDDPWTANMFAAELTAGHYYLAARDRNDVDGGVVGYAGLAVVGRCPHAEAEVHTIAVDPAFQRRGVGAMLLRALLERADTERAPVFLEVRTDNVPAIDLYRAHGFEKVGVRRKYYQPSGADAFTMARPPKGQP